MKRIRFSIFCLCLLLILFCTGCRAIGPNDPITLTVWHVYGDQSNSPLNEFISQYNATAGKERGINVVVTYVSSTNRIHEAVLSAVRKEPGAPPLPDLFVSYPKTVASLDNTDILVDYRTYFSDDELGRYVPSFLEEGYFSEKLLILPVAKSTEVLFVNKTLFDRFAAATGARIQDLATWEGLFETACWYAQWTDMQTPEIGADEKAFVAIDYPFHYMQTGVESLGESFWEDEKLSFSGAYETAWAPLAEAAITGGLWLGEGYASSALRTGDVIAGVGSTASVIYNPTSVTYRDNTSEPVEVITLPCPVFAGGEKLVTQRGAGFCVVKSNPGKEEAACQFLRWLTEPSCNTAFTVSAGYLPVTQEAYDKHLEDALESMTQPDYVNLYKTVLEMQSQYTFYTPPSHSGYLDTEETVTRNIRQMLIAARRGYLMDPESPLQDAVKKSWQDFYNDVHGIPLG